MARVDATGRPDGGCAERFDLGEQL